MEREGGERAGAPTATFNNRSPQTTSSSHKAFFFFANDSMNSKAETEKTMCKEVRPVNLGQMILLLSSERALEIWAHRSV